MSLALCYSSRYIGGVAAKFCSVVTAPASRDISVSATNHSVKDYPKVAVVLSGCGVYDGSEIHEASAILTHLTRAGATPLIYAPDITQMHVVNHSQGAPTEGDQRNVLVEAARIARGQIEPLSSLTAESADALVFPGGFGAAKNLSDFATQGKDCKVIPDVERVIKDFAAHKKPMAFCCIAPVLAARVLKGVNITLGQPDAGDGQWPYAGAIDAVKAWGASHSPLDVHGVCTDSSHKVISTPAFMYDTRQFHLVYDGIGNMIRELIRLI